MPTRETRLSRFWPGLLAGLGIAQLYNHAVIAWHVPGLTRLALDAGIEIPPAAAFLSRPAVFLGVPALLLAALLLVGIGLRRSPRWQVAGLAGVNLAGWAILAMNTRALFQPLLETLRGVG